MNTQQQIDKLQQDLQRLQEIQHRCQHLWEDATYDPETVKEGYGMHLVGHGSDPYPEYTGYRDVKKDRWSRKCSVCGKKEYTYTREAVVSSYKPKF